MENEKLNKATEFMIEKVNEAFLMGMNYYRLVVIEKLLKVEQFSPENVQALSTILNLQEEVTDADLPTKH
jgi:hypothetical protein